jgi:type II secretory pathway component GspD/PulD (secretin)
MCARARTTRFRTTLLAINYKALVPVLAILAALAPAAALSQSLSAAEQTISVSVQARPLGEVLDKIARDTGRMFLYDSVWRSHPVTVSFENTPLRLGLKRVLEGLNSAIVFRPNGSVQLIIIGSAKAGASPAGPPTAAPVPRMPVEREPMIAPRPPIPPPQPAAESSGAQEKDSDDSEDEAEMPGRPDSGQPAR